MEALINDQSHTIPENSTLYEALKIVKMENAAGIAIAVNDKIIRRADWQSHTLNDQDKILIIKATQGG